MTPMPLTPMESLVVGLARAGLDPTSPAGVPDVQRATCPVCDQAEALVIVEKMPGCEPRVACDHDCATEGIYLSLLKLAVDGTEDGPTSGWIPLDELAPPPGPKRGEIVFEPADLKKAKRIRWAWARRLAIGYLNLLVGEEGIGKSTLAAWVIAQLTRGLLEGEYDGAPVMVGIVADEDDFDAVWTPRLAAAGADLDYVGRLSKPDLAAIEFSTDRVRLGEQIDKHKIKVVFFDALLDHLGGGRDANAAKDVREALRPIRLLAREKNIAVWASMHPNKSGTTFRQLVNGSAQFNAVSRSSLLLATDPDDAERRVVVRGKGNYSREPVGLEFTIGSQDVITPEGIVDMPVVTGMKESEWTRDDLLARTAEVVAAKRGGNDGDDEFLRGLLADNGGQILSVDAITEGATKGISKDRMNRAANRLQIVRENLPGFPRRVLWQFGPQSTHEENASSSTSTASTASTVDPQSTQSAQSAQSTDPSLGTSTVSLDLNGAAPPTNAVLGNGGVTS